MITILKVEITQNHKKDNISYTSWYDYIKKAKDTNNTNDDGEYKADTSKLQDSNERVDNAETLDNLRDDSVINKTKEE